MKRYLIISLIITAFVIGGCENIKWPGGEIPCTIYEEVGATPENSLIAKRISNPCQAQRLLVTAAKLGVVWDAYSVEQFDKWVGKLQGYVGPTTTYYDLQQFVMLKVAEFNKKLGGTFLIVSDLILIFPDKEIMFGKDLTLAKMSIEDLKAQVAKLALIYGVRYNYKERDNA